MLAGLIILEGDLRNIISSGRFTLEANKPIDIWVGYIVGQGTSALNSVYSNKELCSECPNLF